MGISILSDAETEPHKALITDIAIDLSRSNPSLNPLHKEHLGSRQKTDVYDSDPYTLKLTCRRVTLERESQHHTLRLATLGSIDVQVLAFQWPRPFLIPTPFMGNDPNAPFLGIHIKLAGIHITDRIEDLKRIVNAMQKRERKSGNPVVPSKLPSFPIPRLSITLECGPVIGRIIYDLENGEKHRAVELRSNGFSVYLGSEYKHPTSAIRRSFPAASSVQSLRWDTGLSINLEPILVRVRSKQNFIGLSGPAPRTSDQDFLDDPPVISIGAIEIIGAASASAQIDGTPDSDAKIDISTLIFDISTVFETICVELWHPNSVDATLRLLSLAPLKQENLTVRTSTPRFLHIPTAFYGKVAVARFVVFITAPDITPSNILELSRGFTMRTCAAFEYCSLRPNQDHWFNNLQRSRGRTELLLPAETLVDALVAAKSFGSQGDRSAFIKMRLADLVFKAAVATQYEPDEPAIVGREETSSVLKEILRIGNIQVDICLSCKATIGRLQYTDTCNISVQIPLIRANFRLAHAFSILLGLQTIMVLNPPQPRRSPIPAEIDDANSNFVLMVQGNVTALQALLTLPTQKLVIRMDGLSGHLNSSGPPRVKWARAATFVSLPPQSNRWETPAPAKWDEFMALQTWELSFTKLAGSLLVSIDGDSARLRIPHGFVLADLVQDAIVSVKAIKHMAHMASAGCYSDMPYPESEGPKEVPHLTIRLDCLSVEAQDDPFETRVALIWRTGAEAVKQRMDREEAFTAKVAAVLSAESNFPPTTKNGPKGDPEPEYQFTSKHSVSIAEARKRLDDVHYLDWTLRLEKSRDRRVKDETSVLHKLCGTSLPPSPDSLLDSLEIPKPSADPPLLRVMLHNLCLTISPPSFSMDRLPDVINEIGNGLPRDTQFSLLVPLHVHFTLSSLHATLRDYPLPLFDIPTRSDNSSISLTFDTDLIVAEEMGTELSVNWMQCPVIDYNQAVHGEAPFSFMVPRTIMPVKTYATPTIKVTTSEATTFSWGVSYGPAIQDVMRIVETLSSPPHDSSPALGFWDKVQS